MSNNINKTKQIYTLTNGNASKEIENQAGGKFKAVSRALVTRKLLVAASMTAMSVALPGSMGIYGGYGGRAHAQALPAGCTDGGNNIAENGEAINCVGGPIGDILTTVDDITINVGDAITPTQTGGILLSGNGAQTVNIYNAGSMISGGNAGVSVAVNGGSGGLTITNEGNISGVVGIDALNYGSGALTITTADVTGAYGRGIYANNSSSGTDLTIDSSAGAVVGSVSGIVATNGGSGVLMVTTANVTGSQVTGIHAINQGTGTGLIIDSSAGTVMGGVTGINATNNVVGGLEITTAAVTGSGGYGINATNNSMGTSLTIDSSAGLVTGFNDAIRAENRGSGGLTITTADVTSSNYTGIWAQNRSAGTDLIIDSSAGAVSGGSYGIRGDNDGTGALTITTADVTGTNGYGIVANNSSNGTDLTIDSSAGAVSGYYDGVRALNYGSGALTITTADVTGSYQYGIYAYNGTGSTNLTIDSSAGAVTGYDYGIYADNRGNGALTITTANVTGSYGHGINASNDAGTTDLTIDSTAGAVTGYDNGIDADNDGSGALTITTADVTGYGGHGIYANNSSNGTSLTIDSSAGAVTGYDYGISAENNGSGALTITTADVTGDYDGGIYAYNGYYGTDLTIDSSAGTVTGYDHGISAYNYGSGALTITTADVTGSYANGIDASNSYNGTSLTIDSSKGAVTGYEYGIEAHNYGSGALTITTADVTSTEADGIYVSNGEYGTHLTIDTSAGTVSGNNWGIDADNDGSGALTITTADVTGTTEYGIDAYNNYSGTDLTIDSSAGSVTGYYAGIRALNRGSGAVTITAADVTGTYGEGIEARNSSSGTALTIDSSAGSVIGYSDGIYANNYGSGALTITTANVTSSNGDGIRALNQGAGATQITVGGAVLGDVGIKATASQGVQIIITDGGSVSGRSGVAVQIGEMGDPASDDVLTLSSGGSIEGDALLMGGADIFHAQGGSFSRVLGGDGTDTVNFSNGGSVSGVGSSVNSVEGFEIFNFNSGVWTLTGTHTDVTTTMIADGVTLNAADASVLSGTLTNGGILNIGNSPGVLTINGDFIQTSTGVLPIEIDVDAHDQLIVEGAATLGGALDITFLTTEAIRESELVIIDAGTGISGEFDSVSYNGAEGGGLLVDFSLDVDATNFDLILTTTISEVSAVVSLEGLNNNQRAIGEALVDALANGNLSEEASRAFAAIGALGDVGALAAALNEFSPETLDAGLKFLTSSQNRFMGYILGQSLVRESEGPVRTASLNGGPVTGTPKEGLNVWAAAEVYGLDQNSNAQHIGFDGTGFSFAAGVSGINAGPISLGFAAGYSNFDGDGDGALGDAVDVSLYHLAGSAALPVELSGLDMQLDTTIAYAGGENELDLRLNDPISGSLITHSGEADVSSFDWMTRLTLKGQSGSSWAMQPFLQAGVNVYSQDAVGVGASNPTGILVEDVDNTRWNIGVGVNYYQQLSDRISLNAGALGTQYFNDKENAFQTRFAAASSNARGFLINGKEVERRAELDASMKYRHSSGFEFSVGAFGEFGDYSLFGGNVRIAKKF